MQRTIEATEVFERILDSTTRYVVNEGGTRSSKTYSFLQWLIAIYCLENTGKRIDIFRKHSATHVGAALDQFIEIADSLNLYDPKQHNKTLNHFHLNGNIIRFNGMDMSQKKRGVERDIAFINEANEFTVEDFRQIKIRTNGRIFIDFNPSEKFWVHKGEIPEDETTWIKSTYLDNPFLPQSLIDEIERMKYIDPDFWRVYGLGELGIPKEAVFPYWNTCPTTRGHRVGIGMDFGFTNDPTTLIELWQDGDDIILHEVLYQTGLTNPDIKNTIQSIYPELPYIVADSAEPKSIVELRRMGLKIIEAKKPNGSVQFGIDLLRRYRIHVTQSSKNVIRELESYKYKTDKFGEITNEPINANNHAIDAARYVAYHFLSNPGGGKYVIGGVKGIK